ncbi:hypothetical protein CL634_09245 [bacterium]|nr:hypothetical protein [bacterium]|tara:strand:+ start:196 stop:654 length:459 start_codon:yes stop_codon:yes gene_type:complete
MIEPVPKDGSKLLGLVDRLFIQTFKSKQFWKYALVGGLSAGLNFSIYIFLVSKGWFYVWSGTAAFVVSAIFNFTSNKLWTFGNRLSGAVIFHQIGKYALVMGVSTVTNGVILFVLTESGGLDYRLSWVLATGIVALWNFHMNRRWTFKNLSS